MLLLLLLLMLLLLLLPMLLLLLLRMLLLLLLRMLLLLLLLMLLLLFCYWVFCLHTGDAMLLSSLSFTSVRSNGTTLDLEDCESVSTRECPSLDDEEDRAANVRNCKEDHQCTRLERMFSCEDGLCRNITGAHACTYSEEDASPAPGVSCAKKRNCVELTGMFDCRRGRCRRVERWSCERRCSGIPSSGRDVNVVLLSGDDVYSARCARAVDRATGETVWDYERSSLKEEEGEEEEKVLVAHCTDVEIKAEDSWTKTIGASDCVNGTVVPGSLLSESEGARTTNLTRLTSVLASRGGYLRRLDLHNDALPFEQDVRIFNFSRLMINSDGCVNTLTFECNAFYAFHGRDGRNRTSPARFPCHYAPHDGAFVVRRYDPERTKRIFLGFFMIPACVLIVSCGSLFLCSRILNIDNAGHMVFRGCGRRGSGDGGEKKDVVKLTTDDYDDEEEDQL